MDIAPRTKAKIAVAALAVGGIGVVFLALAFLKSPSPDSTTAQPTRPAQTLAEQARAHIETLPTASVTRVVDGDTIEVRLDGRLEKVRLLCVDTAETGAPGAAAATSFLVGLVAGKVVRLEGESAQPDRDKYGRLLRYVFVGQEMANLVLIQHGHSKYETKWGGSTKYDREFRIADGQDVHAEVAQPPTSQLREPQQANQADVVVYVTRTGTKYHRAGCRYLRQSSIAMPLEQAKQRYGPCSACDPPR